MEARITSQTPDNAVNKAMVYINIKDNKGEITFDLIDILKTLGKLGLDSTWKISDVDCFGSSAKRIFEISDQKERISGEELVILFHNVYQTLEGQFSAFDNNKDIWLTIEVIDGSEFDVKTDNDLIVKKITKKFPFANFIHL